MACQVRGCVVKEWGHVSGPLGIPHAPTELPVCTGRCGEECKCGRPCLKYNGHEWSCSCHNSDCHEPSCRYCGVVIPAANNGRCPSCMGGRS